MAEPKTSSDDVMREALERFEESEGGTEENRTNYQNDTKFSKMGKQWPSTIEKQRTQEARPALTINKLPTFIRSVVNEARQNKPAIQVGPVDSGADEDSAEIISGLIRAIERNSFAELAYDTAIDHAVTGGFGFFRLDIDYAHEESFDIEARIKRIPNALSVHYDASTVEFDSSDWEYAFISKMVNKREFERRWPKASKTSFDTSSKGGMSDHWISGEDVRVAEYFLRVLKTRKLLMLAVPNHQSPDEPSIEVVREDQLPMMAKHFLRAGEMEVPAKQEKELAKAFMEMAGVEVLRERDAEYYKVEKRIINGVEVLEEDEWPGSTIPICPVWGDEVFNDGKRYFHSMIRDAKDSQTMYNFWRSATTELVALAPKAPWVGPKGFVPKGEETKWKTANTRSHHFLEYNPDLPAPTRQAFAGVPAGAIQEALTANDDMKSTMGIYNPSLGAEASEKSGVAIRARQHQGDTANFHFIDNLSRAIQGAGKILVEIIPSIYSARQTIRILGEDRKDKVINLTQAAGGTKGQRRLYNLSVGKYDVTVKTGPSFATQREETRDTLIEIMRQVPDAAALLGDVLLDHMDFVGADKVAKRLKALLPEAVRNVEDAEAGGDGADPEVAALKQQLAAKDQQFAAIKDQVMAEAKKLTQENQALKADKSAAIKKVEIDAGIKDRELDIKERELAIEEAKPVDDPGAKRAFEGQENERDRQVDLAKSIIGAAEPGDTPEDMAVAGDLAMQKAGAMLDGSPGNAD